VETTIASHLKAWDLWEEGTDSSAMQIGGHTVTDFHIELQYKGYYLLVATIDGRNMKYIIRKGTQEHDDIAKTGLANMTEGKKKELVSLYLLPKIDGDK
jgi:serine/threonine-protein kinase HipA